MKSIILILLLVLSTYHYVYGQLYSSELDYTFFGRIIWPADSISDNIFIDECQYKKILKGDVIYSSDEKFYLNDYWDTLFSSEWKIKAVLEKRVFWKDNFYMPDSMYVKMNDSLFFWYQGALKDTVFLCSSIVEDTNDYYFYILCGNGHEGIEWNILMIKRNYAIIKSWDFDFVSGTRRLNPSYILLTR